MRTSRVPITVVLALTAVSLLGCGNDSGDDGAADTATAPAVDTVERPIEISETIPIGRQPRDVVVTSTHVWVASEGGTLERVDPETNEVDQSVHVEGIEHLATSEDEMWATTGGEDGTLVQLDPESGDLIQTIDLEGYLSGVTIGEGAVWTVRHETESLGDGGGFSVDAESELLRIDPATSTAESRGSVGGSSYGLTTTDGTIWVANGDGTVARHVIDEESTSYVDVGDSHDLIAGGSDGVWATNDTDSRAGEVTRIDPSSGEVVEVISIPADFDMSLSSIYVDGSSVWVANIGDDKMIRIGPDSNEITAEVSYPDVGEGAAIGFGALWVSSDDESTAEGHGTLVRIEPPDGLAGVPPLPGNG